MAAGGGGVDRKPRGVDVVSLPSALVKNCFEEEYCPVRNPSSFSIAIIVCGDYMWSA